MLCDARSSPTGSSRSRAPPRRRPAAHENLGDVTATTVALAHLGSEWRRTQSLPFHGAVKLKVPGLHAREGLSTCKTTQPGCAISEDT